MKDKTIQYKQHIDDCLRIGIDNTPYIPKSDVEFLIKKIRKELKREVKKEILTKHNKNAK